MGKKAREKKACLNRKIFHQQKPPQHKRLQEWIKIHVETDGYRDVICNYLDKRVETVEDFIKRRKDYILSQAESSIDILVKEDPSTEDILDTYTFNDEVGRWESDGGINFLGYSEKWEV